jgi:hypothetical protein
VVSLILISSAQTTPELAHDYTAIRKVALSSIAVKYEEHEYVEEAVEVMIAVVIFALGAVLLFMRVSRFSKLPDPMSSRTFMMTLSNAWNGSKVRESSAQY